MQPTESSRLGGHRVVSLSKRRDDPVRPESALFVDLGEPAAIVAVAGGLDPNDLGQSIERTERERHWSVRCHAGDRAAKGSAQECSRLDSTTKNTAMTRCQRPDDEPEHAEIMREMRLLVTGGAGFIGSNFIRFWFVGHPDDEIINVDLLTYAGDPANNADVARARGDRYSFVQADICDGRAIKEIVAEHPPDVIVNFAAESHNSRGVLEPAAFVPSIITERTVWSVSWNVLIIRASHERISSSPTAAIVIDLSWLVPAM